MDVVYVESEKLWRSPVVEIQPHSLGYDILAALKADDPQRIVEINHDTGRHLTVKDIHDQTITMAQNLLRLGVKKGDFIVLYSNVNEFVTPITFACYTIGAPINFFETKFTKDEASRALELIDPVVIIYEEQFRNQLFESLKNVQLPRIKHKLSIDSETSSVKEILFKPMGDIDSFEAPNIDDPTTHPATLLFTSGSTGFPKVNLHSHTMMKEGMDIWWKLSPGNKIFCLSTLRWISHVSLMLQPIFHSVQRIYTFKPASGEKAREIIHTHKATHTFLVPTVYKETLNVAERLKDPLSSLRIALIGGEPFADHLIHFSAKIAPNCRVVWCYGMTEVASIVASNEFITKNRVNAGLLAKNSMAKIIDEDGNQLGPGEKGRICLKKTVPFLGYLKNEMANKKTYIGDGWMMTGDYGFIDSDNLIHIATRYDNLLRSAGTIIIPTDIENVVNSHPNVVISALVGHPNPENKSNEVGTVFVVLKDIDCANNIEDDLKNFVKDKLSEEQLQVIRDFRVISKLPRTGAGKIDRLTLKKLIKEA